IAGVGLIGGAIGLDFKKRNLAGTVFGWGRNLKKLEKAVKMGAIDTASLHYEEAVSGADLIILATPPDVILKQMKDILPYVQGGAAIIDVGSIKQPIVEAAAKAGFKKRGAEFVGCHPMAGSDKTGVSNACPGLFDGAPCIVTPRDNSGEIIEKIIKLWKDLGSKVIVMDPAEHDRAVGAVSHLPHVMATVLINTVAEYMETPDKAAGISGASLAETTRVAKASPELWYDIYSGNKENLIQAIKEAEAKLEEFRKVLEKGNEEKTIEIMDKAKRFREKLWSSD
ncbi:MAG: prephenate dehydrogenase/arogenate dehydrogenase family protein, partial [Elusimicrobiota bacterium]|nr:prephenate dehydrogenase/arogenate dehydrogenase family protein [Elusimicrobiota bacterium]